MDSTPKTIQRYEVVRRLGGGGMGVVYLAKDPVIGRDVAVKLLRFSDDADARERFQREVRIAGQLSHPNIVRIYDAGEYAGQPFIAMEYVEGDTLDQVIKRGDALELQSKLDYMIDLADAMSAAHARGIVHRDIKPSNLILDTHEHLKVLDFGIARVSDTLQTSFSVIGTPNYMSPEQIRGEPVDARCDVFAAGVVLYELISYRRPFVADNIQALQYRILFEPPPPLSGLAPGIPAALEHVVHKCLEKAPANRPQSAKELQALLRESRHSLTSEQTSLTALPIDGATHMAPDSSKRGATPSASRGGTPARSASAKRVAELRAKQLEQLRDEARYALTDGRPEAALEAAERALVLDENDVVALELADLARQSLDRREAAGALAEARRLLDESSIEPARQALGRVRELWATSADLPDLEQRLVDLERERAAAAIGTTQPDGATRMAEDVIPERSAPPPVRPPAPPPASPPVAKQVARAPVPPAPGAPPPAAAAIPSPPPAAKPGRVTLTAPPAPVAPPEPTVGAPTVPAPAGAKKTPRGGAKDAVPAPLAEAPELLLKVPEHEGIGSAVPDTSSHEPVPAPRKGGAMAAVAFALVLAAAGGGYYFFARPGSGTSSTATTAAVTTMVAGDATPNAATTSTPAQTNPPAPDTTAATGASSTAATSDTPTPTGPVAVGIDAFPWARVAITPVGATPPPNVGTLTTPVSVELAPGEYELTLENGGLTPTLTRRIKVAPGTPAMFRFPMPGFAAASVVEQLMGSESR